MQREDFDITSQPSRQALDLYAALAESNRMVVTTAHPRRDQAEHWMRSQGIRDFDQLMIESADVARPDYELDWQVRVRSLRRLQGTQADIRLLIDHHPSVVTHAMSVGIAALLFCPPRPSRGRADLNPRRIRDWSEIEAEFGVHRELLAEEEEDG